MVFDPDKRQHKIETAGFRIDGDYSHAIPAYPDYNSDTDFNDAFYQERRDECNRLVGMPVQPIIYPGENVIPQPPPGSVAVAIHYEDYDKGTPTLQGVDAFYWLDTDGTITEDVSKAGTVVLPEDELKAHDGFAYWAEDPSAFGFMNTGDTFYARDVEFLPWTTTTALVNSTNFGLRLRATQRLRELQYLDTQNWNSLYSFCYSTSAIFIDWYGAVNWDISNVTEVGYLFKNGGTDNQIADLSHLDWTSVTDANHFIYAPYDGIPRWIEKIEWGSGLNNLSNAGSGAVGYNADTDLCRDGGGNLDLRGWCVSNIASRPNNFFSWNVTDSNSTYNTVDYPLWGECPKPIDQFAFPTDKVVLDLRLIDELDVGNENDYRNIHISGTEAIYPIRDFGGVLKVMPSEPIPADKFVIPLEDIPVGYIFIGDPTTFGFGNSRASNNATYCKVGIGFGEYCDTSLWENDQDVFAPFYRVISGLNYIDTSKFKSLSYAFNKQSMQVKIEDWLYTSEFPWAEMADWDTSNVTNFDRIWKGITASTPKLNWDFSKAESIYYACAIPYGFPKWFEDLQFGPNLTNLQSFGNRFESEYPVKSDYENNYHKDQERPLDLSRWNVINIPSKPDYFFTPYAFDKNMISSWIIQPNWGTDGT